MNEPIRFYDRTLSRMTRRELLNVAWKLGLAAVLQPMASTRAFAQPIFRSYPFALGVASGEPSPDGVVLWTRLAPEPLAGGGMPMANVEVGWEIAQDRAFTMPTAKGVAVARPELGHSVRVEPSGLAPGREYFYRFRVGREVSPIGRTKTAPAAGADVDRLRFAVCGCSHYETGYFTALPPDRRRAVRLRVPHRRLHLRRARERRAESRRSCASIRATRFTPSSTIAIATRSTRRTPTCGRRTLSAPFIVTWDDHEVDNDYAGERDENDTPPEVFLLRRAAAYQAYFETMPLRAATIPSGPNMRIYRRLQFGKLLDLNVLDTRQFRSKQACNATTATGCMAALDQSRTILGSSQEQWLFDQLGKASATWTVLGQQVPTFARDNQRVAPNGRYSMDKWDGYVASRQRLYDKLRETKAPNPIVLSGDVHLHYGADLKTDFENPQSPTVGVEFTNTSITSGADGAEVNATWERIRADNPHIKYHSARRGYVACTATPQTMRADFKILERVTVPDSPERTGGSLVVEAGRPGASLA